MPSWVDATTVVFFEIKPIPTDDELAEDATLETEDTLATEETLATEDTLATEETELAIDEDRTLELATLDTTGAVELILETVALETTDAAELATTTLETAALEITEDAEPGTLEFAVDAALDTVAVLEATDATALDATDVATEDGVSEGDEPPFPPPPPHAAKLHKATPYTIARALWRRGNLLDININDSKLL